MTRVAKIAKGSPMTRVAAEKANRNNHTRRRTHLFLALEAENITSFLLRHFQASIVNVYENVAIAGKEV